MITSRFSPQLLIVDAIRRNHPADLAQILQTLVRHLTGAPRFIREDIFNNVACGFLHDDARARSKPLHLRLFGRTEIIIDADDGELRFVDGTNDGRFADLWRALTGTETEQPSQEGGAHGETHADPDGAD